MLVIMPLPGFTRSAGASIGGLVHSVSVDLIGTITSTSVDQSMGDQSN